MLGSPSLKFQPVLQTTLVVAALLAVSRCGWASGSGWADLGDRLAGCFPARNDWSSPLGEWQRLQSQNFILHINGASQDELNQVSAAAENSLKILRQHFHVEANKDAWGSPCVIFCHRTPESYQRTLGHRAAGTWGCTSLERKSGRITARRIDICGTTFRRLVLTLPHELSHVVLADRFSGEPVPAWLDEGVATLAEPSNVVLKRKLSTEHTETLCFRSTELFSRDSQRRPARSADFYRESVLLVGLLLDLDEHNTLFKFASSAREDGYDSALRAHYGLQGTVHLDELRSQRARLASQPVVGGPR